MIQDPAITLRGALKNNWTLSGDLAVANISFKTGWYDKKFKNLQVTVSVIDEKDKPAELGMTNVRVWARYQIDIWVKAKNLSNSQVGKAKDYLWDMKEHAKDIIKANKTGLTNILWLIPDGVGRPLPELDQVPPLLRFSFDVKIGYNY